MLADIIDDERINNLLTKAGSFIKDEKKKLDFKKALTT